MCNDCGCESEEEHKCLFTCINCNQTWCDDNDFIKDEDDDVWCSECYVARYTETCENAEGGSQYKFPNPLKRYSKT